jgi:hypothetical protein
MLNEFNHFLINGPIPVNFAGLRGSTRAMQADGWELAVETDRDMRSDAYRVRLAGRHKGMNLRTVSMPCMIDRYMMRVDPSTYLPRMEFKLYVCCEAINFVIPEASAGPVFASVNFGSPMMTEFNATKHLNLDECAFFKTYDDSADIYIPKKDLWTTEKHLMAIRDLQKDKQTELRAKARKEGAKQSSSKFGQFAEERDIKLQLIAI